MTLEIQYRLVGTGWAECSITSGDQSCSVTASYLSDSLRNLLLAATAVLAEFRHVSFSFDEEPGEFRWVITSPRMNEIEIEILEFQELWGDKPDIEGRTVFKSRCRPVVFACAVADAAKRVLDAHGEAGYREKWAEHDFPIGQYSELTRAIEQNKALHGS
jgi:hypothetical protein